MSTLLKCTKSALCSNRDRHRGRCNRKLESQASNNMTCKTSIKRNADHLSTPLRCTKSALCSNRDRHRGRCNRKLESQASNNMTCKTNKKRNADHPWYVNVPNSEHNRLKLFGIRIQFTKKKRGRIETQTGTIVAYLPATQEHVVRFDGSRKQFHYQLVNEKNWKRIPWPDNVLDSTTETGETCNDGYLSYGPDCPRCAAFLGVGVNAWSKCSICGLNEPGSCLWSMHQSI